MKRVLLILIPVLIVGAGIGYYFFSGKSLSFKNQSVFNAIPAETPLFIHVSHPSKFANFFNSNDSLSTAFFTVQSFTPLQKTVQAFGKILETQPEIQAFLSNRPMVIAFNIEGRNDIKVLLITSLESSTEADLLQALFDEQASKNNCTISERKYNDRTIYEAVTQNNKPEISLSIGNGLALFSTSTLQVENAIKQLDEPSITLDADFQKIEKTANAQALMNVYMNHRTADRLLGLWASESMKSRLLQLKSYSNWSEFDVTSTNNQLLLSGFSNATTESNFFSNVLAGQKPVQSKTDAIIPNQTAYFLSLLLSDFNIFQNSYSTYLDERGIGDQRKLDLQKAPKTTGADLVSSFEEIFDNEATALSIQSSDSVRIWDNVFILRVKSGSIAFDKLRQMHQTAIEKQKANLNEWTEKVNIDKETQYEALRFPVSNMPELLFGQSFKGFASAWFMQLDNFLLFAAEPEAFATLVKANQRGETLGRNMEYIRFQSGLTTRNNVVFFCNTETALNKANQLIKSTLAEELLLTEEIKKFKFFSWQISASGDRLYNNACLQFEPNKPIKQKTVWQIQGDSPFNSKIHLVREATGKTGFELMVQDNQNNLYLINNQGEILWKYKTDGAVMGTIHQVEPKRNSPFLYTFNTENSIYMIDHGGNKANGFPLVLNHQASAPMSLFDYEQNRTYRLVIPCTNKQILAFDTEGQPVDGWNIFATDHEVSQSLKHFRVDGKDYIVGADVMTDYILDRRGNIRVKTDAVYTHSMNDIYLEERTKGREPRFLTTDQEGNLHATNFEGEYQILPLDTLGANHFFMAATMGASAEAMYLTAEGNQLKTFNKDRKLVFKKEFDYPISHRPQLLKLPKGELKIGVVCASANRIYLLNLSGEMHSGFPLEGNNEFAILPSQQGQNDQFNVFVTNANGQFCKYVIE